MFFVAAFLAGFISFVNAATVTPYVGVDVGANYLKLTEKDNAVRGDGDSKFDKNSYATNFGVNLGVKSYVLDDVYAGLEAHYRFGKSYKNKETFADGSFWKFSAEDTYGGDVFAGYNLSKELSAFVSYGLSQVQTASEQSEDSKDRSNYWAQTVGLGAAYQVVDNVEVKLSYNYSLDSSFRLDKKDKDSSKFKMGGHSLRLGVNYLVDLL